MKICSLNGQWNMIRVRTGDSYPVTVPSDNYTQLLQLGVISDPFYKDNEKSVAWVGREDWLYEKSFALSESDLESRRILLACKGLDTVCDIFINGIPAGHGENAHIGYEFDIKPMVKAGENIIKIHFKAPVPLAERLQSEKPLPKNFNGTDGIAYIRKPHCHFGWDWGPHIPLSGITDDICVMCFDNRLEDVHIKQLHENGRATVKITPVIDGEGSTHAKIIFPDGTEHKFTNNEFTVECPELWWTRELSGKEDQPLYTVIVTLEDTEIIKKIGLRTISLDREPDEYGSNFCFYLNGTPVFAKGSNWIIPDSLAGRITDKTYEYYVNSALECNFNMLRIWGGAYYGNDYLYELCDEKGILVWQDFMFACLMYPFCQESFTDNVLKEIEYQVNRIKSHPSLCLWCGNNEIETMFSYMPESLEIVREYRKFFYETLKEKVTELDGDTPYIETSPIGKDFRKGVTGDCHGDTHMWTVWHGQKPLNYYRQRPSRFCSEFGLESLPSRDAVCQFAEKDDLHITGKIFNSHQKCRNGNRKMLYYLFEKYYEPERFEDLIYMTNLIQKECIQDATEHWRRNSHRCHGSLFWQFNDCWQAPSWSSIDFTGKWKALQYASRHFFEPVCVSIEDSKSSYRIFAINDLTESKNVEIYISLSTLDGNIITSEKLSAVLEPLSAECVFTDTVKGDKSNIFLSVRLFENGKVISERTKIFVRDRDLRLKADAISTSVSYENGEIKIRLASPVFCRSVMLDIENFSTPFSDNYFDLLPNEEKIVTVRADRPYDVIVKSLAEIPVKKSRLRPFLYRTRFFLEPENLANWAWYSAN